MLVLVSKIRSTFKRSPKLSQIKNIVNIDAKELPTFSSESRKLIQKYPPRTKFQQNFTFKGWGGIFKVHVNRSLHHLSLKFFRLKSTCRRKCVDDKVLNKSSPTSHRLTVFQDHFNG